MTECLHWPSCLGNPHSVSQDSGQSLYYIDLFQGGEKGGGVSPVFFLSLIIPVIVPRPCLCIEYLWYLYLMTFLRYVHRTKSNSDNPIEISVHSNINLGIISIVVVVHMKWVLICDKPLASCVRLYSVLLHQLPDIWKIFRKFQTLLSTFQMKRHQMINGGVDLYTFYWDLLSNSMLMFVLLA